MSAACYFMLLVCCHAFTEEETEEHPNVHQPHIIVPPCLEILLRHTLVCHALLGQPLPGMSGLPTHQLTASCFSVISCKICQGRQKPCRRCHTCPCPSRSNQCFFFHSHSLSILLGWGLRCFEGSGWDGHFSSFLPSLHQLSARAATSLHMPLFKGLLVGI